MLPELLIAATLYCSAAAPSLGNARTECIIKLSESVDKCITDSKVPLYLSNYYVPDSFGKCYTKALKEMKE